MGSDHVIIETVQIVVKVVLEKIKTLVVVYYSHFGLTAERFCECVEENLLIDREFVENGKDLWKTNLLQVCCVESLSLFWNDKILVHKYPIGLFDRFLGDIQFCGQLVHGGNLLSRLKDAVVHCCFNLRNQLFVK